MGPSDATPIPGPLLACVTLPFGCTLFPESTCEPVAVLRSWSKWLECPLSGPPLIFLTPSAKRQPSSFFFFFKVETDCFLNTHLLTVYQKIGSVKETEIIVQPLHVWYSAVTLCVLFFSQNQHVFLLQYKLVYATTLGPCAMLFLQL